MYAGAEQYVIGYASKMHCCVVVRINTFANNFCALRAGCLVNEGIHEMQKSMALSRSPVPIIPYNLLRVGVKHSHIGVINFCT